MTSPKDQGIVDAIIRLAEEIGRSSPECAAKARQIVDLAQGLNTEPDRETIQDVLDAEMTDDDLSDLGTRKAASTVAKALKE
jgi:hypothetical protein